MENHGLLVPRVKKFCRPPRNNVSSHKSRQKSHDDQRQNIFLAVFQANDSGNLAVILLFHFIKPDLPDCRGSVYYSSDRIKK